MNTVYGQVVGSHKQDSQQLPALNFSSDSLLAQQVGASELLDRLRSIIMAADAAQRLAHDEPNRVPEVLALIHTSALQSYNELMRAIAFS